MKSLENCSRAVCIRLFDNPCFDFASDLLGKKHCYKARSVIWRETHHRPSIAYCGFSWSGTLIRAHDKIGLSWRAQLPRTNSLKLVFFSGFSILYATTLVATFQLKREEQYIKKNKKYLIIRQLKLEKRFVAFYGNCGLTSNYNWISEMPHFQMSWGKTIVIVIVYMESLMNCQGKLYENKILH